MLLKDLYGTSDNSRLRFRESPELVDNDTFIGIEIELEGFHDFITKDDLFFWSVTEDNSLRPRYTGREFVSGMNINGTGIPLSGENIVEGLREFKEEVIDYNFFLGKSPSLSDRCSIHIHVGVGNLTPEELYDLVVVYLIMEKVLYRYVDPSFSRYYNNYCIPLAMTKGLLDVLYFLKKGSFRSIIEYTTKYDGLNLYSISKKGTIEFRMHLGCYDTDRILEWVNILLSLKKYALSKDNSWLNVLASISGRGPQVFLKEVFGKYASSLQTPHTDSDIYDGIRVAQYVEYRPTTCELRDSRLPPKAQPKLEKLSKFQDRLIKRVR